MQIIIRDIGIQMPSSIQYKKTTVFLGNNEWGLRGGERRGVCSDRGLLRHRSAQRVVCSDTVLLRQRSAQTQVCSERGLLGHRSAQTQVSSERGLLTHRSSQRLVWADTGLLPNLLKLCRNISVWQPPPSGTLSHKISASSFRPTFADFCYVHIYLT